MKIDRRSFLELAAASSLVSTSCSRTSTQTFHVVPNFHPAVMGWLAPYHVERNYCVYGYINHQDHAKRDPDYRYVMSEIPHAITMMERQPTRFEELKELLRQGKTEMVNAFVVEPTVNLSGGEALVMQGVEGLRWYAQNMGLRPRHCWMIDVCGWHEQMAQIVKGLGLESFEYSRYNPTGEADTLHGIAEEMESVHWLESPDGSRILAVNPCHYFDVFQELMRTKEALPRGEVLEQISDAVTLQKSRFPEGAPLLGFSGQQDYSLSFNYKGYPRELLEIWEESDPDTALRFSTLSDWFDEFMPRVEAGEFDLTTIRSGSRIYGWSGFWVNAPQVKRRYRQTEHRLQSVEALASIASLAGGAPYPSQDLSNAWFLMALNMDRNVLWAAGVHATYEHETSWDMVDRFNTVDQICDAASAESARHLLGNSTEGVTLFNPAGWRRKTPVKVQLPANLIPEGLAAQLLEDDRTTLVRTELPAAGFGILPLKKGALTRPRSIRLPETIENDFYTATIDRKTAAITSLRLKASGREFLGGPANVIVAEERTGDDAKAVFAHSIPKKADRVVTLTSGEPSSRIRAVEGALVTIVEAVSSFRGGELRRVIRCYNDSPRIEFRTETNDVPHGTIVTAAFPLANEVTEIRRAIPYGFSHGAWSEPNGQLAGINNSIVPVIRWSHYTLAGGGGLALMDRGVPGREIDGNTAFILLQNATNIYFWETDSRWISGEGNHRFEYALVAHEGDWKDARIPQQAWDYNTDLLAFGGLAPQPERSFLEVSENLILQALRRTHSEIEIRVAECLGFEGRSSLRVTLPHDGAAMTNLIGEERSTLEIEQKNEEGVTYTFDVRPQQIVTIRLKTSDSVAAIKTLTTFDPVVPEGKRASTRGFDYPELAGHPPREPGGEQEWQKILEERPDV